MPTMTPSPGHRFAPDIDGTVVNIKVPSVATPTEMTPAAIQAMMGVNGSAPSQFSGDVGNFDVNFIFPELRNFQGLRWNGWSDRTNAFTLSAWWSPDTTDGINGTWNQITNHGGNLTSASSAAVFRTSIQSWVQNGVKGLRLRLNNNFGTQAYYIRDVQLYGTRAVTGDHLQMWEPTTDAALSPNSFDYGDIVRGVYPAGRTFRVKNTSATLTANAPSVSFVNTTGVNFMAGELSTDGVNWTASAIALSNLAPGAISPLLYFRPKTDPAGGGAIRAGRVQAVAGSWA